MPLSVVHGSTDQDLSTTGRLKALAFGATATSTAQDQLLADVVRRASKSIESYIGQPLSVQTYRETVAGFGRRSLVLARTPLRAVLAVYDSTDTGTATVVTTDVRVEDAEAGLLSRDQGFGWSATLQFRASFSGLFSDGIPLDPAPVPGQEYRPWMVDYVAGYAYGGVDTGSANWPTSGALDAGWATSTGRTLPEDLEHGVLLRANGIVAGGDDLQSEKLGDMETNYRSLGTDKNGRLITPWQQWVEPYRRLS